MRSYIVRQITATIEWLRSNWSVLAGLVLTFGAYSDDSVLLKFIWPEKVFSVNATMAMQSSMNNAVGIIEQHTFSEGVFIAPVFLLLNIDIGNKSDEIKQISSIELFYKNEADKWIKLNCLHEDYGFYYYLSEKNQGRLLDFVEPNLLDTLKSMPIKPKEAITGWLLVESMPQGIYSKFKIKELKINLITKFKEIETAYFNMPDSTSLGNQIGKTGITPKDRYIDISKYKILRQDQLKSPAIKIGP